MCSDAANGDYEELKVKSDAGCPREGEATTSQGRLHLNGVLEMLIRLDQQGLFMNNVDNSLASDCSPMCFSKMQEKVFTEQYPSWMSFVEDFETICHNAMEHNQKRSEMWNAANSLLRQGRRCLEQQALRERTHSGSGKKMHDNASVRGDDILPRVKLERHGESSRDVLPAKAGNTCDIGRLVPPAEKQASSTTNVKVELTKIKEEIQNIVFDKVCSPSSQPFPMEGSKEDVMVDILELSPGEDIRLDFDKQATDCSSSFGDTQNDLTDDEMDHQSCEVESELRNGNGATSLTEDVPSLKRRKKALNPDWKTYRQGIEWRCRWLELRVKELQVLSNKYDRILVTARSEKKPQKEQQDTASARTSAVFSGCSCQALWRQQRRKEEENVDSKSHMSRHPLFSRYEKKQQRSQEELATDETTRDESYQLLDFDDFNPDYDYSFGEDFLLEEDSMEQYLWHVEALQLHVCRLKNLLTRGTVIQRSATGPQAKDVASPGGVYDTHPLMHSPGRLGGRSVLSGKAQGGKSIARRRASDFDINNVIMPDTVMVNYIEPARHAFIETPNWRILGEVSASARGGSSEEEDTDDEVYKKRHVEMQVKEHQEQIAPWNKSQNMAMTREHTESATAAVEKNPVVNTIDGDDDKVENVQNVPNSFGFVPRRKRRRRESRDIASITKNIEPLLSASHKNASERCEPGDPMEEGDCPKTSSTD